MLAWPKLSTFSRKQYTGVAVVCQCKIAPKIARHIGVPGRAL